MERGGKLAKTLVLIAGLLALGCAPVTALAAAEEPAAEAAVWKPLAAALAVGLAGIGAGYAVGVAGSSGLSALVEKPELASNVILIVALGEGIAIYGLLIAILIIFVM